MLLSEGEADGARVRALSDALLEALECKLTVALLKRDNPMEMVPRFLFRAFELAGIELGEFRFQLVNSALMFEAIG